ncbi:MAG: hypothetical protein ACRD03_02805 [Acidimicrobiales bacterium]
MTTLSGITVADLQPGDRLTMLSPFTPGGEQSSTFVQRCQHPIWTSLQLVIWRMDDGTWLHDALDARQGLPGTIDRAYDDAERTARLRAAVLGPPVKDDR